MAKVNSNEPRRDFRPSIPIYVVDDNRDMCRSLEALLTASGYDVSTFTSPREFLAQKANFAPGVLIVDLRMEEMDGIEVVDQLKDETDRFPAIMITAHGDVEIAVKAIKLGAKDFIQKPFRDEILIETIERLSQEMANSALGEKGAREALTGRERDVADRLAKGFSNKQIAYDLGISVRTVEMHRARAMQRLGCKSFAELLRVLLGK